MSYRHLELPKSLVPQRRTLLDLLPGWDVSWLRSALQSLREAGSIDPRGHWCDGADCFFLSTRAHGEGMCSG